MTLVLLLLLCLGLVDLVVIDARLLTLFLWHAWSAELFWVNLIHRDPKQKHAAG